MTRGFYTIGSSMITQNRILSATANNIANVDTAGFKKDKILSTTFGEMVMNRVDGKKTPLGDVSMMRRADESVTIHSQGSLKDTDRALDFAIVGEGFFRVQTENGVLYTRNGNFALDNEGYLVLDNIGRVLGENGPILLGTDHFNADNQGNLYTINEKTGQANLINKLNVYTFADYNELQLQNNGLYQGNEPTLINYPELKWKTLEGSNVEIGREMTETIEVQRNLQTCAQVIKMYDQTMARAVTEIGKI